MPSFLLFLKQFDTSEENKNTLIIETVLLISFISLLSSVLWFYLFFVF